MVKLKKEKLTLVKFGKFLEKTIDTLDIEC